METDDDNCGHHLELRMQQAARDGNKDLVESLINEGATTINRGMYDATIGNHKDLIEFFIEKGADELDWCMQIAAEYKHKDLIDFFIDKGACNWWAAMHGAIRGRDKDLVEFFILKGINNTDLNRGLYEASKLENLKAIKLLIKYGANDLKFAKKIAREDGKLDSYHFIEYIEDQQVYTQ